VTEVEGVRKPGELVGRDIGVEGKMLDGAGKLYAHATTTCIIFR
jgi:acyl-coenzyme A thioesterase PaaI-like protein